MNNSEFDVIQKYFTFANSRDDVILAAGDDCACVAVPQNKQLLITTDTLISGVHFPDNTPAEAIACKSLMVNLSDLAAMGAAPAWVTLAISLPEIDDNWLRAFSTEFAALLSCFNISLIGGDTTRGALSITVQAMGLCDEGKLLRRDQAQPGDRIYVTGSLGDAAIGLRAVQEQLGDVKLQPCIDRLNRPQARVSFAEELTSYSVCAIDISDGLAADLGHILTASNCGANIQLPAIPLSVAARYYFENYHNNVIDWPIVLTQGDDYELCFTANSRFESAIQALAEKHRLTVSCIGEITESEKLVFIDENSELIDISGTGYQHF
jgi:thiamine-monophosphate kinase